MAFTIPPEFVSQVIDYAIAGPAEVNATPAPA
jgi:hypothetical protein